MTSSCSWLHEQLQQLPLARFPFELQSLPENGIYFFYEHGEQNNHDNTRRVVRVGTARQGNFCSRIKEHFLLDERKMGFNAQQPAPKERSVFRKNIGRALLNRDKDAYLKTWEIDYTTRDNRDRFAKLRDIQKEKTVEREVTRLLRSNFSFRYIVYDDERKRMGADSLEAALIATLAQCNDCVPSKNWLGLHSPKPEIRESGLWLSQHLNACVLGAEQKQVVLQAVKQTLASD